jgi:hypothetical protein
MPKFSSVDVLFKRTPEGWTFNSSYPGIFGPLSTYLLTDVQKVALEQQSAVFQRLLDCVLKTIAEFVEDLSCCVPIPVRVAHHLEGRWQHTEFSPTNDQCRQRIPWDS